MRIPWLSKFQNFIIKFDPIFLLFNLYLLLDITLVRSLLPKMLVHQKLGIHFMYINNNYNYICIIVHFRRRLASRYFTFLQDVVIETPLGIFFDLLAPQPTITSQFWDWQIPYWFVCNHKMTNSTNFSNERPYPQGIIYAVWGLISSFWFLPLRIPKDLLYRANIFSLKMWEIEQHFHSSCRIL